MAAGVTGASITHTQIVKELKLIIHIFYSFALELPALSACFALYFVLFFAHVCL